MSNWQLVTGSCYFHWNCTHGQVASQTFSFKELLKWNFQTIYYVLRPWLILYHIDKDSLLDHLAFHNEIEWSMIVIYCVLCPMVSRNFRSFLATDLMFDDKYSIIVKINDSRFLTRFMELFFSVYYKFCRQPFNNIFSVHYKICRLLHCGSCTRMKFAFSYILFFFKQTDLWYKHN